MHGYSSSVSSAILMSKFDFIVTQCRPTAAAAAGPAWPARLDRICKNYAYAACDESAGTRRKRVWESREHLGLNLLIYA